MPKVPVVEVEGSCGFKVTTKTWKQGHSLKCERRGASAIRYWQPDKGRYYQIRFTNLSNICAEVWDFCRTCRLFADHLVISSEARGRTDMNPGKKRKKRKTKKLLEYYEVEIKCPECGHNRGVVTKQGTKCLKCRRIISDADSSPPSG